MALNHEELVCDFKIFQGLVKAKKKLMEKVPLETDAGILESEERKWGLPLKQVYKLGLSFFKDHDGIELQLTYAERLQMVAYTQQAVHGPLAKCSAAPFGVLDMIGRDRRAAWNSLKSMSRVQAMAGFVRSLDRHCALFRPYMDDARKRHEQIQQKELKEADEEQKTLEDTVILEDQNAPREKIDEGVIQKVKEALNAQTYQQFAEYAAQQYPGDYTQQAVLVRQLQAHHLRQYLQQVSLAYEERPVPRPSDLAQQLDALAFTDALDTKPDAALDAATDAAPDAALDAATDAALDATSDAAPDAATDEDIDSTGSIKSDEQAEEKDEDDFSPDIEEARMWTKPEIKPFKESARASDGFLTVCHGETVTLRVPTHRKASSLCWEFATDNYDIGFGLNFEWSKPTNTDVTIYATASDDDDDDTNNDDNYSDAELGPGAEAAAAALCSAQRAPVNIIVPIYRRDSHIEVYIGTHKYPGEGIYLIKFDNTYSMLRSKTVYYKIHHYYGSE